MKVFWKLGMEHARTEGAKTAPRRPVPWFGSVTVMTPDKTVHTRSWHSKKGQPLVMRDVMAVMHAMVQDIIDEVGHNQGIDAWWSVQSR
jgi:hypothetical protein